MERAQIERDLTAVSSHLAKARDELALVTDQLAAFADEADAARLRALLAETPQSLSPVERAHSHIDTLTNARLMVEDTIGELERVRDDLLVQLLALDIQSRASS